LNDSDLVRPEAEIDASAAVGAKPDHAVAIDFENLEYFAFIRLQAPLIFRREFPDTRRNRHDAHLRAYANGTASLIARGERKTGR